MIYLVKSDKTKFRFFFQETQKALDFYYLLKDKNSELLSDLQMKKIDFSDSKETQELVNEVYRKMYEE